MSDRREKCERCGKPHDLHPSIDVSNTDRFYLCEDRAQKCTKLGRRFCRVCNRNSAARYTAAARIEGAR